MQTRRILAFASLLAIPLLAQPQAKKPSPLVGRIGDRGFLQVESPSFAKLPLQQKLLAYHLTRAAIQLDPVFYDQMSSYGVTANRLLTEICVRGWADVLGSENGALRGWRRSGPGTRPPVAAETAQKALRRSAALSNSALWSAAAPGGTPPAAPGDPARGPEPARRR
jgi:hypothetical protein